MSKKFALQQTMRWYGPNDPVSLQDIAQAGCSGVVSALHAIPVGEVWPVEAIQTHLQLVKNAGLDWEVVESLPVHEDIKTGSEKRAFYIENYKESLRNLAACGIKVVTYNFMPILDWVRTQVDFRLPNGSEALFFRKKEYQMFDLFILKRPAAASEYTPAELQALEQEFDALDEADKSRIATTVLLGLPGSDVPFTREQVLELLENYRDIDRAQLKKNLFYFLSAIAPTADEVGLKMAIHPDDPPFSVLGLPRILCTDEDIHDLITSVPSPSNGLCFCTGSLGARSDNNLVEMMKKWASRVYFLHFRSVKKDAEGNFMEANHLDGDADMFELMKIAVQTMQAEQRNIPMRPDHGHKMLDDLSKKTYPGYSAIGRLKGLAELRGVEYAVARMLD